MLQWILDKRKNAEEWALFSAFFSVFSNFAFAFYNGILGYRHQIPWNSAICFYYFLLGAGRLVLVLLPRVPFLWKREAKILRSLRWFLLFLNFALVAPIALMVKGLRSYTYGLIPAIAMAAYTTSRICSNIFQFRKAYRERSILAQELRTIGFVDSLVAVLSLQNALVITCGDPSSMRPFDTVSSFVLFLMLVLVTLFSFWKTERAGKVE